MRAILIDESPVFREGLKVLLNGMREITVVREADSFRDILEQIQHECDLVVIDGEVDALTLLRNLDKLNRKGRPPFVLILAAHGNDHQALQMFRAGADGYLPKSERLQCVLDAIRRVSRGSRYIREEEADSLLFDLSANNSQRLSSREYEVLCLMASGLSTTEIAGRLLLSVKTVSTYRARLLEKLHLKNNADLVRYAYKEGIMV
jgi:two-component system invasion response regulator UvrY